MDMRDAFFDEVYALALSDKNIMFLTADMGAFSLTKFQRTLPKQFINVGIAEQFMVDLATGLSLRGKKVFIYAIIPFVTFRCYEHLMVNLSGMDLAITVVGVGAGVTYGVDGPTHHGVQDIAIMKSLPGITIFNPSDPKTVKEVVKQVIALKNPTYVRLEKGELPELSGELTPEGWAWRFECEEEEDLLIVSSGMMVHRALLIKDVLQEKGLKIKVLDLCKVCPLSESIKSVFSRAKKVVVLEEHSIIGGIGDIVKDVMERNCLKVIAIKGFSKYHGDRDWLHHVYGLDVNTVVTNVLDWLERCKNE